MQDIRIKALKENKSLREDIKRLQNDLSIIRSEQYGDEGDDLVLAVEGNLKLEDKIIFLQKQISEYDISIKEDNEKLGAIVSEVEENDQELMMSALKVTQLHSTKKELVQQIQALQEQLVREENLIACLQKENSLESKRLGQREALLRNSISLLEEEICRNEELLLQSQKKIVLETSKERNLSKINEEQEVKILILQEKRKEVKFHLESKKASLALLIRNSKKDSSKLTQNNAPASRT